MRPFITLLIVALIAVTTGTSNAGKASKSPHTALQGYCPVAYAMGKAVKGDPKVSSVRDGRRYLFMNADAKKMFDADPAKYQVAYEGWCATAIAVGKKLKSDPKLFTDHDGKAYLFSNVEAKQAFDAMPDEMIQKADAQWAAFTAK